METIDRPAARTAAPTAVPRTPFETLCGRVPTAAGAPTLFKSAATKAWAEPLQGAHSRIAIDGWFVLDGRLLLGRSASERELVAREIERDLDAFLARLDNGFFNIVVHDDAARTTRIANDRFGGLPLYLHAEDDALLFASTMAGLLELAVRPPERDPVGLAELYWFGYQLGERTAHRHVQRLPPGSVLAIDWASGRRTLTQQPPLEPSTREFGSPAEAADHLAETMAAVAASLVRDDVRWAAKISAGMDSRFICAAWPGPLHTYTFGHPAAHEIRLAERLAAALGAAHTTVPLRGDFFSTLHAPIFRRHGIMEWFHQALLPAMQRDGIDLVLDGLAGDVLVGGLTLKRSQSKWRQALGLAPDMAALPADPEGIARYLIGLIKVPDGGFRPLKPEALAELNAHWDEIALDMAAEVRRAQRPGVPLEQVCGEVIVNNRTRRHISLQGTVCRPEVETIYPFLDRRFLALAGRFPQEWIASKRLYLELFTRHYPRLRGIPSTYSMLPFTVPKPLHIGGRIARYALERFGTALTLRSAGRLHPFVADGMQWRRWLVFEPALQRAAQAWLEGSSLFVDEAYEQALQELRRHASFSGTRFMYTASYLAHFRDGVTAPA